MSFVMFSLLSHNFKYTHIHTEWTLEQHGFELHESTVHRFALNQYILQYYYTI